MDTNYCFNTTTANFDVSEIKNLEKMALVDLIIKYTSTTHDADKLYEEETATYLIFKHAQDKLKDDDEVARLAITADSFSLDHVSQRLKNDKELVWMAVSREPISFRGASELLKNDPEFVLKIIQEIPNGSNILLVIGDELYSLLEDPLNHHNEEYIQILQRIIERKQLNQIVFNMPTVQNLTLERDKKRL